MTAKKHWFLKTSEEFCNKNSDLDISWSSSSPEKDNYVPTKKLKSNSDLDSNHGLINGWIKIGNPSKKSSKTSLDENFLNICSQFTSKPTYPGDGYDKPSISSNHTFEESPIIGSLNLGEVSPVLRLTQGEIIGSSNLGEVSPVLRFTQSEFLGSLRPSPVIGKRRASPVIGQRRLEHKVRRVVKDNALEEHKIKLLQTTSKQQSETLSNSSTKSPPRCQVISKQQTTFKSKRHNGDAPKLKHELKFLYSTQQSDTLIENVSPTPAVSRSSRIEFKAEENLNNNVKKFEHKPESLCIYLTQHSDTIIESNTPSDSQKTDISIASEKSYCNPLNYSIDPFLSQECSEIIPNIKLTKSPTSNEAVYDVNSSQTPSIRSSLEPQINTGSTVTSSEIRSITESTESSSSKSSNFIPLYHEVLPKKKKRYKKEGLADQLQKALHKQKTDFAIWRHELYLRKTNGCHDSSPVDESSVLLLKITKFWKEFGVTIVKCEFIKDCNEEVEDEDLETSKIKAVSQKLELNTITSSCPGGNIKSKNCLVVIGFNVAHNLRIKINAKFKLCMPYKTKIVKCNGESIFCYFNVSKILSFK